MTTFKLKARTWTDLQDSRRHFAAQQKLTYTDNKNDDGSAEGKIVVDDKRVVEFRKYCNALQIEILEETKT